MKEDDKLSKLTIKSALDSILHHNNNTEILFSQV